MSDSNQHDINAKEQALLRGSQGSHWMAEHPVAYRLIIGLSCAILYFAILSTTLSHSSLNGTLFLRPALGLAPALSLYFGWPALIGCVIGNIFAQMLIGTSNNIIVFTAIGNIFYFAIPYFLWYVTFAKSKQPYPRLDSATKMGVCFGVLILGALFDAAICMLYDQFVGLLPVSTGEVFQLYFSNDFLFSTFLGVPLLILLERSPLVPLPPPWINIPYRFNPSMSLTQRNILLLIATSLIIVIVFDVIDYLPAILEASKNITSGNISVIVTLLSSMLSVATLFLLAAVILGTIAMRYIETHFTLPIERVANVSRNFVEQVATYQKTDGKDRLAISSIDLSGIKPAGEITNLINDVNHMRCDLIDYVEKLEQTTADAERVATELSIARSIQLGAVPHDFTAYKDRYQLDIAAIMRPAREVGGDFYDVFDTGPHTIGFIIADVSGKGISAALFMMRALAEIREQIRSKDDVGKALTIANQSLCEHNDAMLFVTAFAAVLDAERGRLTYVNAGHNPVWHRSKHSMGWLEAPAGFVMGVMDDVTYTSSLLALTPGDGLFFYTDGVTEAINADEKLFGADRLDQILRQTCQEETSDRRISARRAVQAVVHAVDEFSGDQPQFDDITMLCMVWDLPVFTLQLPPQDSSLPALFAFLEPFCEGVGRTPRMAFELQLILEELFVNVSHYGFPEGRLQQPVSVQIAVDESSWKLYLTLSDAGIPYDPLGYEPKKIDAELRHRIGGLGILLVRELADDVYYERASNLNIVRIVKSFV